MTLNAHSPAMLSTQHQQLIEDLVAHRFAITPSYLSGELCHALRAEIDALRDQGALKEAGIGRRQHHQHDRQIRKDRTYWLDGGSPAQRTYIAQMERLRLAVNRALFMGLFELESHFALYLPGDFYRRHVDAFKGSNGRRLSTVVYLNDTWCVQDGGQLRLWAHADDTLPAQDVLPEQGTLACFLSEDIPHEVLPAIKPRYSIAGWFRCNNTTADWLDPPPQ